MRSIAEIFRSYGVLDGEGRHVNGTDKETNHRYGDAYEGIFSSYWLSRNNVRLMMEVGVADGSSLLAWTEVFPNARCVGMDIHDAHKISSGKHNHTEFHMGDQRNQVDCERAAGGRQFDVIVEDATHRLADSLLTMFFLWPYVKPGGLYIIEEFDNVGALRKNIAAMWPNAVIVDTQGPFGGVEPLVVFRKQV